MKNFISFIFKFIAIAVAIAAAAYWLNHFLTASGKKELLKNKLPSAEKDISEDNTPSCSCNDAVCAVDMCMPY